jgi:predicted NBD/HSP70 family sugar kinase
LASAQNLLDLEAIIVGGGLGDRLGQPFVDQIVEQMTPHLFVPDEPPVVLRTELGDLSGAVGAAMLAGDQLGRRRRTAAKRRETNGDVSETLSAPGGSETEQ